MGQEQGPNVYVNTEAPAVRNRAQTLPRREFSSRGRRTGRSWCLSSETDAGRRARPVPHRRAARRHRRFAGWEALNVPTRDQRGLSSDPASATSGLVCKSATINNDNVTTHFMKSVRVKWHNTRQSLVAAQSKCRIRLMYCHHHQSRPQKALEVAQVCMTMNTVRRVERM